MRVTSADLWEPAPGEVLTWQVAPGPARGSAPLTLNQRNHLAAASAGEPSVWLAAAFEVPGRLDVAALTRAYADLVARHGVLQLGTTVGAHGELTGRWHDPGHVDWRAESYGATATVAQTREALVGTLAERCQPVGYPAFAPVAISRPTTSTVVLGLDHLLADAHSIAVVVDDLHRLYAGAAAADLPETTCFVRGTRPPARVAADDPRLRRWQRFLGELGGALPTFPLPLGVPPGERRPQATLVTRLLDAAGADRIDATAAAVGASPYAVALSAFGQALRDLGAPARVPLLVPVGTRRTPQERRAVGWFTTTVPFELRAGDTAAGVGARLRAAIELAGVPLDQVIESLPTPLRRERADVFMVSWLDYRRLPGAGEPARRAHHVSAPTRADDLQLWLSRTDDGLWLRARLPETPTARSTVASLVAGWRGALSAGAGVAGAPAPAGV